MSARETDFPHIEKSLGVSLFLEDVPQCVKGYRISPLSILLERSKKLFARRHFEDSEVSEIIVKEVEFNKSTFEDRDDNDVGYIEFVFVKDVDYNRTVLYKLQRTFESILDETIMDSPKSYYAMTLMPEFGRGDGRNMSRRVCLYIEEE